MDAMPPPVGALIQHMRAGRNIDVDTIERIVGVTLRQTGDSNASFTFYAADHVVSGSMTLDVEMRSPVQNGRATSGTLLMLNLAGGCTRRKAVEARYGPLTLSQPPRADAPGAEAHWSRREPWGDLSFGFSADRPDCLTSVVFSIAR
ncbi:MAG: hypothetical protein EOO77_41260 [Oxalobacteraceae bacterium]|nr:MAG: hypothetical protein EOO77_41260 [Oxalobacteraceae bacterium]